MDKKEYQRRAKKAYRLRRRVAEGRDLSPEDTEWLAEYDRTKRKSGRKVGQTKAALAAAREKSGDDGESSSTIEPPGKEPSEKEQAEPPRDSPTVESVPPPPPPPTPILDRPVVSTGRAVVKDWRTKYIGVQMGREQTCTLVGSIWRSTLKGMVGEIESRGSKPWLFGREFFDDQETVGVFVLAVDNLLPPDFDAKPELVAAATSSVVVTQRFLTKGPKIKTEDRVAMADFAEPKTPSDEVKNELARIQSAERKSYAGIAEDELAELRKAVEDDGL